MKTKRITMLIEILLFLLGLILACYFTFSSNLSGQKGNLLCSLSIGLSTGGMVAFLIETPNYFAVKKQNETVLHVNLRYIYMYLAQLQDAILKMQLNPTDDYITNFAEWHFNRILPLVFPITTVDRSIYWCRSKNKEIIRLQKELNTFATNTDAMMAPFAIKSNTIQINALKMESQVQIINEFLETEFTAFLGTVGTYIKTIDDVMQILCNKKQLENWNLQIGSIKDTLYKINIDLQNSKK